MSRFRIVAAGVTAAVSALALAVPAGTAAASTDEHHGPRWSATWGTAQQHPMPGNEWFGDNWSMDGFDDQSVRQVVRVSEGGSVVRIRLSNLYGEAPLEVTGATIAKAGDGAAIRPGTLRPLTFDHRLGATVPAGEQQASDPTALRVRPLDKLTVTLYFAEPTGVATFHQAGFTTTYRAEGDHRFDHGGAAYAGETSHSWYYLTGVDVAGVFGRSKGTVVAFGDSITDGSFSTPGTNNTYPDELAERLVDADVPLGVVNTGINGNKVLTDSTCLGEKAVTRIYRDVVEQPGVRTAIVLEGINDIGSSGFPPDDCGANPEVTLDDLIEGHRTLIRIAHRHDVKIVGATLTPIKGSFYDTPDNEALRDGLNEWIRTSGEYDAVADFDRALADPDDPDAILPAYNGGDALHPNDAGMKAMADAIDLGEL